MKIHTRLFLDFTGIFLSCAFTAVFCEALKLVDTSDTNRLFIALPVAALFGITVPKLVNATYSKFKG